MAVPFSNTKLRVPRGFQNLLEGLAKEVLRNQPENIYTFAAIYFDNLVKIREEKGTDPAEIGAKHEDRFYNNKAFAKAGSMGDVSDPQQQAAATTIQAAVRGHQAREAIKTMEAERAREEEAAARVQVADKGESRQNSTDAHDTTREEAATRIQAAYRGYEVRKNTNIMKPSQGTMDSESVREDAAVKIQAAYRGYEVRKNTNIHSSGSQRMREDAAITIKAAYRGYEVRKNTNIHPSQDAQNTREEEAATTIQAAYRGYEVRKNTNIHNAQKVREEDAAIRIQAAYRGYDVRKKMDESDGAVQSRTKFQESEVDLKVPERARDEGAVESGTDVQESEIDLTVPEREKAAVKIQASFRGYQTRKTLKDKDGTITEPPGEAPTEEVSQEGAEETKPTTESAEEVIDIDLSDPEVEKAAVKIQGGFKMLKAKREVEELRRAKEEAGEDAAREAVAADREEKIKPEEVTEQVTAPSAEEEVDIDLEDPEVGKAAEKIQATFRGFQTRKKLKEESKPSEEAKETTELPEFGEEKTEDISGEGEPLGHIDASDPQQNLAASKIQAGFKGMKVRKELKTKAALSEEANLKPDEVTVGAKTDDAGTTAKTEEDVDQGEEQATLKLESKDGEAADEPPAETGGEKEVTPPTKPAEDTPTDKEDTTSPSEQDAPVTDEDPERRTLAKTDGEDSARDVPPADDAEPPKAGEAPATEGEGPLKTVEAPPTEGEAPSTEKDTAPSES